MPAVPDPASLGELPLFANLAPEELTKLNHLLRRTTVPPGTTLMTVEQPAEVAYLVVTGSLKVHIVQEDGRDVILAILGPGALVGELSLIEDIGRSATVVTIEQSTLLWLDRTAFQMSMQTIPAMTQNVVRILARRIRLANAQIQLLASKDVFARIACLILAFADAYGQALPTGDLLIPLRLTQSDLASLVGASRVRVNQVLGYYKARGYLTVQSNYHLVLHDRAALELRSR